MPSPYWTRASTLLPNGSVPIAGSDRPTTAQRRNDGLAGLASNNVTIVVTSTGRLHPHPETRAIVGDEQPRGPQGHLPPTPR